MLILASYFANCMLQHLHGGEDESLVDDVCGNTMRYINLFAEAADSLMEGLLPNTHVTDDVFDMLNKTVGGT